MRDNAKNDVYKTVAVGRSPSDVWFQVFSMVQNGGVTNKNIDNPKFNYCLFQEKCTKDKLDCYDGLDRHNLCCYIYEGNERLIKSRYADFPW